MKIERNFLTAALVALAFLVGPSQALAQRGGDCVDAPVLYSDDGYRGRTVILNEDISDLHRSGMGDDASSVCVPFGWRVVLYKDSDYRGSYLELRGPTSIADLKRDRPNGADWGDAISSVRVYRPVRRGGRYDCRVPTLFGDDDFGGRAVTADSSIPDLHRLGVGDQASSLCVPAGWLMVIYEDTNYRGRSLDITGPDSIADLKRDRPDGSDWGDRISSVEVFRGGRRGRRGGDDRGDYDRGGYNSPRAACDRYPLLYSDDDFRGRSLDLSAPVPDLHSRGFGDQASSICIPSGWRVVLYEDTGYRGQSLVLDGPREVFNLDDDYFGDRASSIDVQAPGRWRQGSDERWPSGSGSVGNQGQPQDCDRYPVVFSDSGFRGRSLRLDNSVSDLSSLGFGDQISSICVPSGWRVVFYSDSNYRGDSLQVYGSASYADLSRDRPNGSDWGDRISSVQVSGYGRR